jgi:hypothetical protein
MPRVLLLSCAAALLGGFAADGPTPAPLARTAAPAIDCFIVGLTVPPYTRVTVCPPVSR